MVKKTSRTFVWIILGLSMIGLVGFGSRNFGGSLRVVATVGSTEIDANRYFRELRSEFNAYQAQTGQPLTMSMALAFGVDQSVLARLIAAAALDEETARLGLSVGDGEVRARVVEISAFQGIDGKFDREAYNFALKQSGLTAAEFEASLRADVARTILHAAVANGIATAPAYVDSLFAFARETRDFTWAPLGRAALETAAATPDEAAVQAWYDANQDLFTLPETKSVTYAWLSPESVIPTIAVDEAELHALYESRIADYMVPERRIVERLVFGSDEEAQAAALSLADGSTDFETLVAERGLQLADIDLGDVSESQLGAAGAAVFAAPGFGVAGPVATDLGPALFRINAVLPAQETSFDEAREELLGEYAADHARRLLADMVGDLDDLLAGGATLEELSSEHAMGLGQIDWSAGQADGIAAYESFRAKAASTEEGDYPEIVEMEDGGLFALRVDAVTAPRLQTLDEVRDQAVAFWTADEELRLLKAQAETYLPRFEAGESPSTLGMAEIAETQEGRGAFIEGTPPAMITEVFDMAPGEWRVIEDADGVIVIRLDAINAAPQDSEEAVATKAAFAERSAQEIGLDIENAFSAALQAQAGITINQAVITAVHSQFP